MVSVVTGFVPIPGHPRTADEYRVFGESLLKIDAPVDFTINGVEECWLYRYLDHNKLIPTHSTADNPAKNSLSYHIVQHQKSDRLARAAVSNPTANVLVWIDFGIFHLDTVTREVINDFLDRVEGERDIVIPGCWTKEHPYDDRFPHWRFCGGVIVIPRNLVVPFDDAVKRECIDWVRKTGNLSWEVNTMARVEQKRPDLPIRQYMADHDRTMFTHYKR